MGIKYEPLSDHPVIQKREIFEKRTRKSRALKVKVVFGLSSILDVTKTDNGEWGMGNGEWGMGNGEWEIENGKWEIENGKLIFFVSLFHYLKLYLLMPGWSVRLVKNCDRGLENVASAASGSIFQA